MDQQQQRVLTPASEYLKSDEIGLVIAKGMAVLYKANPKNPVDFLAKWLLNYAHVQKAATAQENQAKTVDENRKHHVAFSAEEENKQAIQKREADQKHKNLVEFADRLRKSDDLNDQLQELVDLLKTATNSTSVYVGKLIQPTKPIREDSDDTAHFDFDAEKIIRFNFANKEHQFLIDKTLSKEQGLTFDVFKNIEELKTDEPVEEDENGEPIQAKVESQELQENFPRHILVPEVVREPRMHFYRVPRLGSYLAIRLEYDSCLFEDAFDVGLADYLSMRERQKQLQEDIRAWEEHQRELQEEAEAAGEPFVPEKKVFEEITAKPFKTQKIQLVVCLNTLGHDRNFSDDERKAALRTVQQYRDIWEKNEQDNLRADIELRLFQLDLDKKYKEVHEALDNAELEIKSEQALAPKDGDDPTSEDQRQNMLRKARFQLLQRSFFAPEEAALHQKQVEREKLRAAQAERVGTPNEDAHPEEKYYPLAPQQWRRDFTKLKELHVLKFPRILQTLFFLLRYSREDVCERDSARLELKKAKNLINDKLFQAIATYNPYGPNDQQFKSYQKLAYLKRNIESVDEEKVEEHSVVLLKIMRWVQFAIEQRIDDVVDRRNHKAWLKKQREDAIAADNDRTAKMNVALEEAKALHEAKIDEEHARLDALEDDDGEEGVEKQKIERERIPFDMDEFNEQFDENNPPITIPPEVNDDVDNDFDLPWTAPVFDKE